MNCLWFVILTKEEKIMTTSIEILASSKPLVEEELLKKNEGYVDNDYLGFKQLTEELAEYEYEKIRNLFTMPYLYSVFAIGIDGFYDYLQNQMELGDTIELFEIPDPEKFEELLNGIHLFPYAIEIDLPKLTYKNQYGTFLLNKKNWIEDLKHRALVVPDGITVIRNY